jgi:hypothetical protein
METTTQNPPVQASTNEKPLVLKLDFTWRKFQALVSDKDDPENKPLYIADSGIFKSTIKFLKCPSKEPFATGRFHAVKIDADIDIRGKPIKLKAMSRLKTRYSHYSYACAKDSKPALVDWTSESDFKTWDFICSDSGGNPIAKYESHIWAIKKVGFIEFAGPRSLLTDELIEEMLVTGVTLVSTMTFRTVNTFNLCGALISTPGHKDKSFVAPSSSVDTESSGGHVQSVDTSVATEEVVPK